MKKFVELEIHDYMDMYPRKRVNVLEEETIADFIKHMNENYSGGITRLSKVLTAQEALEHCKNQFADIILHPAQDEVGQEEDRSIIDNLIWCYRECYMNQ